MKSDPWLFTDEWEWRETAMINLGDKVRDSISGYEGIVIGITEWLYQCRRLGIQPMKLDKDGKPMAIEWFDEPQCVVVEDRAWKPAPTEEAENGGPKDAPTRNADPTR